MTAADVIDKLRSMENLENATGMERFGIVAAKSFGIPTPDLKLYARELKKRSADSHTLALELWKTGIYDARAVAFMIDDPAKVTERQMDAWAKDFDNWATVDGACCYLFCRTPFAYGAAFKWADETPEFIRRAGFSLMAFLAVHDKKADDAKLAQFLPTIQRHACDDRNFVKKAVNWALRQIGKRSLGLNSLAVETAEQIAKQNTSQARWIAADALRELCGEQVQARLRKKASQ